MPIYKIDDIKINGKNQAFGGFIYNLQAQIGVAGDPTRITVAFFNETGDFLEPELSVTKGYRIEIGNLLNGNFFPVTRDIARSTGDRVLKVQFVDGSCLLNRVYVGLYKRHGDENTQIPGLIIVGKEIHPCDINEDGVFDSKDVLELQMRGQDPCELRCPTDTSNREPVLEDCVNKEITDIFDVKYSFRDLLDAIQGKSSSAQNPRAISIPYDDDQGNKIDVPVLLPGHAAIKPARGTAIKIKNIPSNINETYKASYSGRLRDVLKSWCSDFGWSFYWENDSLNFVDTRQRAKPIELDFENVQSINDHKTIEGTVSRGFISQYLEPGIIAKTECEESRPYLLKCLNLADLFGERYKPSWAAVAETQGDVSLGDTPFNALGALPDPSNSNNDNNQIEYIDDFDTQGMPIRSFEASCVMSFYSEPLRHLYNLWEYYQIKDSNAAFQAIGKWMDRLGQIKIVNVFSETSSEGLKKKFNMLLNDNFNTKEDVLSKEERQSVIDNKGYFVVALKNRPDVNYSLLNRQFSIEENLATGFIGCHWYRAYVAPFLGETPQIFPNGQYFGALATNIKDLPFANFNHSFKSSVSKMVSSFVQRQRNDFRQYGMLKFSQSYLQNVSKKLVRSMLYNRKETSDRWSPLKNTSTSLDAVLQETQKLMFKKIDISNFGDAELRALVTNEDGVQVVNNNLFNKLELYIFYPGELKITSDFVENPNEENPSYTESNQPFGLAQTGLTSKKCVKYTVKGVSIYTPAGGSVQFDETPEFKWLSRDLDNQEFTNPSYKIYVTNSCKNRGILSKTEAVLINPPDSNKETMEIDFTVKQLTNDSTKFIARLDNKCRIDPQSLEDIHDKLAENLDFSIDEPIRTKSYSFYGLKLPKPLTIKDGLESMSISVDGQGGVITEISIGNSLYTPPSPDAKEKMLEQAAMHGYWNYRKNPLL